MSILLNTDYEIDNASTTQFDSNTVFILPKKLKTSLFSKLGEIAYDSTIKKVIISDGNTWAEVQGSGGDGDITSVNLGPGLVGGPITVSGVISLDSKGVTGGYTLPTLTVDSQGRITAISSNSSVGTISGISSSGSGITVYGNATNKTVELDSIITPTTVNTPTLFVTSKGLINSVTNGTTNFGGSVLFVGSTSGLTGQGITDSGTISFDLVVSPLGASYPTMVVDSKGRVISMTSNKGLGTLTSLSGSTGITGGITTSGTLILDDTIVTPGTYSSVSTLTVDPLGRLISVSSSPDPTNGIFTNINTGQGLTGGQIMTSGFISLQDSGVSAGGYTLPTFYTDSMGRVLGATSPSVNSFGQIDFVGTTNGLVGSISTTGNIQISNKALTPDSYSNINVSTNRFGLIETISSDVAVGSLMSIFGNNGVTGGVTISGNIELQDTAVTPGSYLNANVTVDNYGRIISASTGNTSALLTVNGNTVNGVFGNIGNTNGTTGTISLVDLGFVSGTTYSFSTITVDSFGRITGVSIGAQNVGTVTLINSGTGVTGLSVGVGNSNFGAFALADRGGFTGTTYINPQFNVNQQGQVVSINNTTITSNPSVFSSRTQFNLPTLFGLSGKFVFLSAFGAGGGVYGATVGSTTALVDGYLAEASGQSYKLITNGFVSMPSHGLQTGITNSNYYLSGESFGQFNQYFNHTPDKRLLKLFRVVDSDTINIQMHMDCVTITPGFDILNYVAFNSGTNGITDANSFIDKGIPGVIATATTIPGSYTNMVQRFGDLMHVTLPGNTFTLGSAQLLTFSSSTYGGGVLTSIPALTPQENLFNYSHCPQFRYDGLTGKIEYVLPCINNGTWGQCRVFISGNGKIFISGDISESGTFNGTCYVGNSTLKFHPFSV